jgi:two-component system LytT family response regulator
MKTTAPPDPNEPAQLLIIDDDEQFGLFVAQFLRQQGFEVVCARSGQEGIRAAADRLPDLVICDLEMPGMNGQAVLANLRLDARLADVSLIFLTGQSAPEQIRAGMNLGADDYLTKPVDADELLRAVKARLARAQIARRLPKQRMADNASDDTRLGLDDTILVKNTSEKKLIRVREVKRIIAYGEYSWVYWEKGRGALLRKPLKQWEAELPEHQFIRIHRQAIINLAFLERVEKPFSGGQKVHLRDTAEPIAVSQRLAPSLNRKLKEFKH